MNDSSDIEGPETGQTTATATEENESKEPAEKKQGFQFPSTFAILFGLTILVAILTWIIPAGVYNLNAEGNPEPGTYHQVPSNPQGVGDILMAPINGMYGLLSNPGPLLPAR